MSGNGRKRVFAFLGNPTFLRGFHLWATIGWLIVVPIVALTDLRKSVVFLVAISVYAIVVSHWSAWQSSRVEVKQEEQAESSSPSPPEGLKTSPEGFEASYHVSDR